MSFGLFGLSEQERLRRESETSKARTSLFVKAIKVASRKSAFETVTRQVPELTPSAAKSLEPAGTDLQGRAKDFVRNTLRAQTNVSKGENASPRDYLRLTPRQRAYGAPKTEALRNTPGTLENAMAQIDAEFGAQISDEERAGLKAQLAEFAVNSETGQRSMLEGRSLLDAFREQNQMQFGEEAATAPLKTLFPDVAKGPVGDALKAVGDYPYRLIGGAGRFPVMGQEAVAGVLAGDKTAAQTGLEFAQGFNPAEKGLDTHEIVSRILDVATLGLSAGHGIKGFAEARKSLKPVAPKPTEVPVKATPKVAEPVVEAPAVKPAPEPKAVKVKPAPKVKEKAAPASPVDEATPPATPPKSPTTAPGTVGKGATDGPLTLPKFMDELKPKPPVEGKVEPPVGAKADVPKSTTTAPGTVGPAASATDRHGVKLDESLGVGDSAVDNSAHNYKSGKKRITGFHWQARGQDGKLQSGIAVSKFLADEMVKQVTEPGKAPNKITQESKPVETPQPEPKTKGLYNSAGKLIKPKWKPGDVSSGTVKHIEKGSMSTGKQPGAATPLTQAEREFLNKPRTKPEKGTRSGYSPEEQAAVTTEIDTKIREHMAANEDMPTPEKFAESWDSKGKNEQLRKVFNSGPGVELNLPQGAKYTLSPEAAVELHRALTGKEVPVWEELTGGKAGKPHEKFVSNKYGSKLIYGEHDGRKYVTGGDYLVFDDAAFDSAKVAPYSTVEATQKTNDAIATWDSNRSDILAPQKILVDSKSVVFQGEKGEVRTTPRSEADLMYRRGLIPVATKDAIAWIREDGKLGGVTISKEVTPEMQAGQTVPYKTPKPPKQEAPTPQATKPSKQAGRVDARTLRAAVVTGAALAPAANSLIQGDNEAALINAVGGIAAVVALRYGAKALDSDFGRTLVGKRDVFDLEKHPLKRDSTAHAAAATLMNPWDYAELRKDGTIKENIHKVGDAANWAMKMRGMDAQQANKLLTNHFGKRWGNKESLAHLEDLGERLHRMSNARVGVGGESVADIASTFTPKERAFLEDWSKNFHNRYGDRVWAAGGGYPGARSHAEAIFEVSKGIIGKRVRWRTDNGAPHEGVVKGYRNGNEDISKTVTEVANRLMDEEPGLKAKDARVRAKDLVNEAMGPFGRSSPAEPYYIVHEEFPKKGGGTYTRATNLKIGPAAHFKREQLPLDIYFMPQEFKSSWLQNLRDERFLSAEATRMTKAGTYPNEGVARAELTDLAKQAYEGNPDISSFMGALEKAFHRVADPTVLEHSFPLAWSRYIDKATRRTSVMEFFGPEPGALQGAIDAMESGDKGYMTQLVANALRLGEKSGRQAGDFMADIDRAAALPLLTGGGTHIMQMADLFAPVTHVGLTRTLARSYKWFKQIGSKESVGKLASGLEGSLTKQARAAFAESDTPTRATWAGASTGEKLTNVANKFADTLAGAVQLHHFDAEVKSLTMYTMLPEVRQAVRQLSGGKATKGVRTLVGKDPAGLARRLKEYGFDDADIARAKKEGVAMLDDPKFQSKVEGAIRRNFMYSGQAMNFAPWMGTWYGRVLMRFKRPMFTAGRYVMRDVLGEAAHGNLAPLANALVVGGMTAEAMRQVIDKIKGNDSGEAIWTLIAKGDVQGALARYLDNMYKAGVGGPLFDLNPLVMDPDSKMSGAQIVDRMLAPVGAGTVKKGFDVLQDFFQTVKQNAASEQDDPYATERFYEHLSRALTEQFGALRTIRQHAEGSGTIGNIPGALEKAFGVKGGPGQRIGDLIRMRYLDAKSKGYREWNEKNSILSPANEKFRELSMQDAEELAFLRAKYNAGGGKLRAKDTLDKAGEQIPDSIRDKLDPSRKQYTPEGMTRG